MEYLIFAAIRLTLNYLNLIKWKDEKDNIHNFYLALRTSDKWQAIGTLLKKSMDLDLDEIKNKHTGNHGLCWCSLMENWLCKKGSPTYPANWGGLYKLLKDSGVPITTLRLLKKAVIGALRPSHSDVQETSAPNTCKILVVVVVVVVAIVVVVVVGMPRSS